MYNLAIHMHIIFIHNTCMLLILDVILGLIIMMKCYFGQNYQELCLRSDIKNGFSLIEMIKAKKLSRKKGDIGNIKCKDSEIENRSM